MCQQLAQLDKPVIPRVRWCHKWSLVSVLARTPGQSFDVIRLSFCCFNKPKELQFTNGSHEPRSVQLTVKECNNNDNTHIHNNTECAKKVSPQTLVHVFIKY